MATGGQRVGRPNQRQGEARGPEKKGRLDVYAGGVCSWRVFPWRESCSGLRMCGGPGGSLLEANFSWAGRLRAIAGSTGVEKANGRRKAKRGRAEALSEQAHGEGHGGGIRSALILQPDRVVVEQDGA